jgi:hypothetical protein
MPAHRLLLASLALALVMQPVAAFAHRAPTRAEKRGIVRGVHRYSRECAHAAVAKIRVSTKNVRYASAAPRCHPELMLLKRPSRKSQTWKVVFAANVGGWPCSVGPVPVAVGRDLGICT